MGGFFPVMIGGAIGAGARHLIGTVMLGKLGPGFPWWTLTINLIGGLLMGVVAGTIARGSGGEGMRLLLGVGVLGGFTTFSAFSLESWQMIERGQYAPLAGYVLASVIGSVAMVAIGIAAAKAVG